MVMVDDATNRTWARFSSKETTRACYDIFEQWMERNGLPRSLYADRHSIYLTQREPTVTEQLAGKEPKTQFGRAMKQLGVKLIPAGSPQAKGRVERMNGTLQDRLVKAMRLEGISDMERANDYLAKSFLPELNRRFMRVAARRVDLHQRKREGAQRSVELGGATSGAERLDGELKEKELPVGSATREPEFGGENDHREAFERREPADGVPGKETQMEADHSGSASSQGSREKAGAEEETCAGGNPPVATDEQSQCAKSMGEKGTEKKRGGGRACMRGRVSPLRVATGGNVSWEDQDPVAAAHRPLIRHGAIPPSQSPNYEDIFS